MAGTGTMVETTTTMYPLSAASWEGDPSEYIYYVLMDIDNGKTMDIIGIFSSFKIAVKALLDDVDTRGEDFSICRVPLNMMTVDGLYNDGECVWLPSTSELSSIRSSVDSEEKTIDDVAFALYNEFLTSIDDGYSEYPDSP